jgi:hypothetical protein
MSAMTLGSAWLTGCDDGVTQSANPVFQTFPSELTYNVPPGDVLGRTLTVTNAGQGDLVISSGIIEGGDKELFTPVGGFSFPVTIKPGEASSFEVEFARPDGDGAAKNARIVFATNQSVLDGGRFDGVFNVNLRGLAADGRLFATPASISYGRVSPGECRDQTVTIQALGSDQIITEITLASTSVYRIVSPDPLPTAEAPIALAAGESFEVTVNYCPDDEGSDTGKLGFRTATMSDSDPDFEVDIIGNGGVPCIQVTPSSVDFGDTIFGQKECSTITVNNCSETGNGQPLEISDLAVAAEGSGADASLFSLENAPELPATLAPGEATQFVACFSPTDTGRDGQPESGSVVITSNDQATPEVTVPLNGVGTTNQCPNITAVTCVRRGVAGGIPTDDVRALPLDNLDCVANCVDPDGSCASFAWNIVERPAESVSEFSPASASATEFFVDANGEYVVEVDAQDNRGTWASQCGQQGRLTIRARPEAAFHVQMTWATPSDPNPSDEGRGAGSDVDLHVLHPLGCWEDVFYDCHFRNRAPDWDVAGFAEDNASLDRDDTDGWGPENVSIKEPVNGNTYRVASHYWSDFGYGLSNVTVVITLDGVESFRDSADLTTTGQWWEVAAVSFPARTIVPIDRISPSRPTCAR